MCACEQDGIDMDQSRVERGMASRRLPRESGLICKDFPPIIER
jgi:hypothetical protein